MGSEIRFMAACAPLIGALITLMSGINSRLSGIAGNLVATLVIHVVGLAAVSVVLLLTRPERQGQRRLPLYYYLGGFVGVGTVFSSNYAFGALGASLAVALGLLGQTLFSVAVDATGFMGRVKYPLSVRRLPGICLAIAGVAIMGAAAAGSGRVRAFAILIALAGGALPGLTFILNSELGRRKGILRSTRVNYIVGLATTLLIVAAVRPPAAESAHALLTAGPFLALGGGLMGVAVVSSISIIFPRMPAFSSTLLLFSGQALCGVLIDIVAAGAFDVAKLVGTIVLLAGLAVNGLLNRRESAARRHEPDGKPQSTGEVRGKGLRPW